MGDPIEIAARANAVRDLATHLLGAPREHPLRVAIDGRTASGKTTLANELAVVLRARGCETLRTSIDEFHRPREERYRRGRFSPEGYLEDARDWHAARRLLLDPLGRRGNRLFRLASFDLERDVPLDLTPRHASDSAVLLVDGTFLQCEELAGAWDVVVFVDVSEEIATNRGVARDASHLGGEADARDMHQRRYQAAFTLYEARCHPRERADVVWNNDDPLVPEVHIGFSREPSGG